MEELSPDSKSLLSCWEIKDRRAAIRKLSEMASEGHVEAFKALMAYAYGKPQQRVELTQLEPVRIILDAKDRGASQTNQPVRQHATDFFA